MLKFLVYNCKEKLTIVMTTLFLEFLPAKNLLHNS